MKSILYGVAVGTVIGVCFLSVTMWKMGVAKGEISLHNRYDATENTVETALFQMRSIIKNQHKCTDEWADKFIMVVSEQSKGRPGRPTGSISEQGATGLAGLVAGGVAVTRESEALGIPQDLYLKLASAIEGQMANFVRQQNIRNDVWREHKTFCEDPFHNMLGLSMASKVMPKPQMITSSETKSAMAEGVMNEDLM